MSTKETIEVTDSLQYETFTISWKDRKGWQFAWNNLYCVYPTDVGRKDGRKGRSSEKSEYGEETIAVMLIYATDEKNYVQNWVMMVDRTKERAIFVVLIRENGKGEDEEKRKHIDKVWTCE